VERIGAVSGRNENTMNFSKLNLSLSSLPRISYGPRIHPARDWVIVLLVSLVVLAGFVVAGVWLFLQGDAPDPTKQTAAQSAALSPELLSGTDALFEERAQESVRYQREYQFVDPAQLGS